MVSIEHVRLPLTASGRVSEAAAKPLDALSAATGISSTWLLVGALVIVLALLAGVLAVLLRRKRSAHSATTAVAADGPQDAALPSTSQITPPAPAGSLRLAVHQHIGKREDQQDSYVCTDPAAYGSQGVLAAVADGMGGLSNGAAVSEALVRTLEEGFRRSDPGCNSADLLLQLAIRANAQVAQLLRDKSRSGSTLVAAVIRGGVLHFFSVGDSRIYLYRGGGLIQLNREHVFQEELALRALNRELPLGRVRTDRQAHFLTSYFGIDRIPALDRNDEGIKLVSGDKLLLASDGVFGTLTAAQLEEALRKEPEEAASAIGAMIESAGAAYQDNNTAVILEYHSDAGREAL